MQISSNTWTWKANFAALLHKDMHFSLEKLQQAETFVCCFPLNALMCTYSVAELLKCVFYIFIALDYKSEN